MKKIVIALIVGLASVFQLSAEDCWSDMCCTDCFGFESVLSFDIGAGFREDNIKWDSYPQSEPPLEVQEKWQNLRMGIVETNGQFLACDHYLVTADFDFGWFNNENGKQRIKAINLTNGDVEADLEARTTGRMYDVSGAIGYQFNWCNFRYTFAPLVGYSYHYQKLKNRYYENELNAESETKFLSKNNYIYRWRGPTLGCTLSLQASCDWDFYFTYNYHWLRFRGSVDENFEDNGTVPDNFVSDGTKLKQKFNGAGGSEFILGTTYDFSGCWYLGFKVNYKTFSANKGSFTVEEKEEAHHHASADKKGDMDTKYPMRRLRWDSLFATVDIGLIF